MADISKITLPSGDTYDLKDETAQNTAAENTDKITDLQDAIFNVRKYANNETGIFTISIGGINANGNPNSNTNRAKTTYVDLSGPRKLVMTDDTYNIFRVYIYESESPSSMTRCVVSKSQKGTKSVIITPENAETRVRVVFTLASDEDHVMTNEDFTAISERFQLYTITDTSFTMNGIPADSYTVGLKAMVSRGTLGSTDDVDTAFQRGVYFWAGGDVPQNAPSQYSSRMIVLGKDNGTNGEGVSQLVLSYQDGMFFRVASSSGFGDFIEMTPMRVYDGILQYYDNGVWTAVPLDKNLPSGEGVSF